MFLSVSDLQHRNINFDLEIAPGELNLFDEQLRQESVLRSSGTVRFRLSTREILIQGSLVVTVSFPCDRCLAQVTMPLEQHFDLVYLPEDATPVQEEREIGAEEVDLAFYEGGGLELDDVLREQVLLALPMRRVCQPVCANEPPKTSEDASPQGDARWKALEGFRPAKVNKK